MSSLGLTEVAWQLSASDECRMASSSADQRPQDLKLVGVSSQIGPIDFSVFPLSCLVEPTLKGSPAGATPPQTTPATQDRPQIPNTDRTARSGSRSENL
jgi:hypothetical protein